MECAPYHGLLSFAKLQTHDSYAYAVQHIHASVDYTQNV